MGIQLNDSELGAKWRIQDYIKNGQYDNIAIARAILNDINSRNLIINSNDIADLYNSGLDFTYNSEDPNKKTGYALWNLVYHRTGLNKYFGYDNSVEDYLGPTTATRMAVLKSLFNPDGTLKDVNTLQQNGIIPSNNVNAGSNRNLNAVDYGAALKSKPSIEGFSDWVPHTLQTLTEGLAHKRNYNLETLKLFPKIENAHFNALRTNAFLTRTQLELKANEIRNRGTLGLGSNLDLNLQQRLQNEQQAQELELQALAIGDKADLATAENVQKTANVNLQSDIERANYNTRVNAAAKNNLIAAQQQYNLKLATNLNTFVGNLYTDLGKYRQMSRLNEQNLLLGAKLLEIYKLLRDKLAVHDALASDYTKSKAYNLWLIDARKTNLLSGIYPDLVDGEITDSWLKSNWSTLPQAQKYRDMYNAEVAQSLQEYQNYEWLKQMELEQYKNENIPLYTGNLLWNKFDINRRVHMSPAYKKGGKTPGDYKMDRLLKYHELYRKSQDESTKALMKANKDALVHLDKELDRLNREQVAILRQLFK